MPADRRPRRDRRVRRRRPGDSPAAGAVRSGDAPRRLAQVALRDLPWESASPSPTRSSWSTASPGTFGGLTAVDVDHLEVQRGAITALIGPNGAGKTTFFNLLTGFDQPDTGHLVVRRHGRWASCRPHQVARLGMVRTFQLTKALSRLTVIENMRLGAPGPARRDASCAPCCRALWRAPGEGEHRARPTDLLERFKLDAKTRRLRRHPLRRPAQAARDGPGADERPEAGHARRADGRREPGADPVAARPRQGPARARA